MPLGWVWGGGNGKQIKLKYNNTIEQEKDTAQIPSPRQN